MKKVEQPWKLILVLLLVATAASIIKHGPASVRSFDVSGGALSYKVDPDWPARPALLSMGTDGGLSKGAAGCAGPRSSLAASPYSPCC